MSVGASQKCGWGKAIKIRTAKGKCGVQPEVWLTIRIEQPTRSVAGQSGVKGMCGSQSEVWLIDKEDKDRPHDESSEVMSHGQVTEHGTNHVTEHVMGHVTEHVTGHVTSQTA